MLSPSKLHGVQYITVGCCLHYCHNLLSFSGCKLSFSAFCEELKELISHQGAALLCMGRNFLQVGRNKQLVLGPNLVQKQLLAENNLGVQAFSKVG